MPDEFEESGAKITGQIILALDPGRKKTGVAIGNQITASARPLETITGNLKQQLTTIEKLCTKWQPTLLVIGLPDAENAKSAHAYAKKLASSLQLKTKLNIDFYNEEFTSQAAQGVEQSKTHGIDAVAASIIAQDWLERDSN